MKGNAPMIDYPGVPEPNETPAPASTRASASTPAPESAPLPARAARHGSGSSRSGGLLTAVAAIIAIGGLAFADAG